LTILLSLCYTYATISPKEHISVDRKYIKEHFNRICLNNRELIKGSIKGIALYFTGLGHQTNPCNDMVAAPVCAENGVLYILPFYNPWCWMNAKTVSYIDTVVDVAKELYGLDDNIPVGLYGGSMGGYNIFHYAIKSKHRIVAADLLCPCCNTEYELSFNPNTIFRSYIESAVTDTDDIAAYVSENSPVNMVDKLARIPYRFAVGLKDTALVPVQHSFLMVEKMRAAGYEVEQVDYPEVAHCNLPHKDRITEHVWLCEKILNA